MLTIIKLVVTLFKAQKRYTKCRTKSIKKQKKNGKTMLSSRCAACSSKINIYERTRSKRISKRLGFKRPLSKIPLFGDI